MPARSSFGELLARASAASFVGRDAEMARWRDHLDSATGSIVWLHGPGGVGKSALSARYRDEAMARGVRTLSVDMRYTAAAPGPVLDALGHQLHVPADDVLTALSSGQVRWVLHLDTMESARPLEGWLRQVLLPVLPGDSIVVLASRHPPDGPWRDDPGWSQLVDVMELRNLSAHESSRFLTDRGIDETLLAKLVKRTHGHPLALSLAVEVAQRNPGKPIDLTDNPDVVDTLFRRFIDKVPTDAHRRALSLCARSLYTPQRLLGDLVSPALAGDLMHWLAGLPFIKHERRGLVPHDIARDIIAADARWRDPDDFAVTQLHLRQWWRSRMLEANDDALDDALRDYLFLGRLVPNWRGALVFDQLGAGWYETPRPEEFDTLGQLVARHVGPEHGAIVRRWLDRPECEPTVTRGDDGQPIALGCTLRLRGAVPEVADPVIDVIMRRLQLEGAAPAARVVVTRLWAQFEGWNPAWRSRMRHRRDFALAHSSFAPEFAIIAHNDDADRGFESIGAIRYGDCSVVLDGQAYDPKYYSLADGGLQRLTDALHGLDVGQTAEQVRALLVRHPMPTSRSLTGRVIGGRYRLIEHLGAGGMGVVYRAEDLAEQRLVAVKVLRPERADDATAVARFGREAQALAGLDSPHLVKTHTHGQDADGDVYIVMELAAGMTLREHLTAARRLSWEAAVALVAQVASGLGVAHEAGIVHRDIKPDNVLLVPQPDRPPLAKVIDFGVALDMASTRKLTLEDALPGTLHYLAPERVTGEAVDARVDVYAMGAMLYELLTGATPFNNAAPADLLLAHVHDDPPPFRPESGVPEKVQALVWRCLAKTPESRPADGRELAAALQALWTPTTDPTDFGPTLTR